MESLSVIMGIGIIIVSSIVAYDKVQPDSFLATLGFLITWILFGIIGKYIVIGVVGLILAAFNGKD